MATISIAVTPTFAQSNGTNKFQMPSTIDSTKLDIPRLMDLLYQVKQAFSGGVIKAAADTVSMTLTIDGTTT